MHNKRHVRMVDSSYLSFRVSHVFLTVPRPLLVTSHAGRVNGPWMTSA